MSSEGVPPASNSSSHTGASAQMAKPECCPVSINTNDAQLGIRIKCPKVLVGPVELGIAATYSLDAAGDDKDEKLSALLAKRLKPTLTVKDTLLRGKLELEPQARKLHYSKKLRLPFANTELLRLRLTAQWPSREAAGGLLGRALGLTLSFEPERLHQKTLKAPAAAAAATPNTYSMQLTPRVGPPQLMYNAIGFPGSVYLKANTTLTLSDSATLSGLRAHLDVQRVNAVVRLYDPAHIKPCRLARSLTQAARQLVLEDVGEAAAGEQQLKPAAAPAASRPAVKVVSAPALLEPHTPDAIDRAAAKVREWTYAVAVNSCVATEHLRHQANMAGEKLRALLAATSSSGSGGKGDSSNATAAEAVEPSAGKCKSRGKGRC
ncbi:hypothetical protein Agub_g10714 [Astrephomene gubernaculifera]|uniref:Uncharacterized protein n=1 Tax=Astrephomene gubernaculifera TaxID=47775 RepID=A0AAD3DVY9_9CHLO|nr:hypothetical protein Agub_g10714 [Astrephomene gubernaculifera]